ncbi:MAG: GspE/PulE family protein [Bacillota bacterium]
MLKFYLDPKLTDAISESLIKKYLLVPINLEDNVLKIACINPENVSAILDVCKNIGYKVHAVTVDDKIMEMLLEEYFNYINYKKAKQIHEDNVAINIVNYLIEKASKMNASDIHIEVMEMVVKVRFRIDGVLVEVLNMPRSLHQLIVSRIKIIGSMDIAEKRLPQDGRIDFTIDDQQIDLRISTIPTVFGEKVVIRLLKRSAMLLGLERLGMDEKQLDKYKVLITRPYGLLLFTGPTGSGKTTSLYATLNHLNNPLLNIVTIEDPVEYLLAGINQIAVNFKIGLNFASGLRSILRQDPDVIMVGEIRDNDTARIAVRAAITGHQVFSTLHTNNAAGAITRLIDMGVEPYLVASALNGVVAQRLVRIICTQCKISYKYRADGVDSNLFGIGLKDEFTLFRGEGCIACNHTGYRGRTALFEILPVTDEVKKLILQKVSTYEIFQKGLEEGMIPYTRDGFAKVLQGITTIEEVRRVSFYL